MEPLLPLHTSKPNMSYGLPALDGLSTVEEGVGLAGGVGLPGGWARSKVEVQIEWCG